MTAPSSKPSQDFVPIQEIRDGVVILKNHGMRLVLMVSSLNFALKSTDEQTAIIMQFQNLLNSLDFHIQIFVQSRRRDMKSYIRALEERLSGQVNELLKVQTSEYIQFIREFTDTTEIMEKNFFVVVPYSPMAVSAKDAKGFFSKFLPGHKKATSAETAAALTTNFEEQRTQLEQRAAVVAQGLSRLGLRAVQLGTEELVELYAKIFNPGENEVAKLT